MKRRFLVLLVLFSFILALSGCALLPKKEKQAGNTGFLEPQAVVKFSDIPVPAGFKLLPFNSYSFQSSGVRVCVLKYQGKAGPDQVINFYREQMPMYNWNLLNIVEYGDRMLNFDRDNETCVVSLLPKGKTVLITVSVGPKPQLPKKPAKPVK